MRIRRFATSSAVCVCALWSAGVSACSPAADRAAETRAAADTPAVASSPATSPPSATPTAGTATLTVATHPTIGTYLADGAGRALYLFEQDTAGTSTCYDACAAAWPPYVVSAAPTAGDSAVRASMIATVRRKDDSQQVSYNRLPLYYYAGDAEPGDINGQDLDQFGAEWYLVTPDGTKREGQVEPKP